MSRHLTSVKRFLAGVAKRPGSDSQVPKGRKVYAIGDIHGRADLLAELHESIAREAAEDDSGDERLVIYLGDYVDRGMESRQVIDLLIDAPLEGFVSIHLKGNHEDTMLRFLEEPALGEQWFAFGGEATVMSYGVALPRGAGALNDYGALSRELRSKLPERHYAFLTGLQLSYQVGDYFFVHAGVSPQHPLDQQEPDDLIWIRSEFLNSKQDYGAVVVHGHTPTARPDVRRNRIGIDTGAFASGTLTCLVLEANKRRFISTAPQGR